MKFNLTVADRLNLLNMLPKEGNIVTMRTVRKLLDTIALTDEEQKIWNVKTEGTNVRWDSTAKTDKNLEFSDIAIGIIKLVLKKQTKEEKITLQTIGLFDKFIPENEPFNDEEESKDKTKK